MRLTYSTQFNFKHQIQDRPELVDKTCCTMHEHLGVRLVVKVHPAGGKFLDFKLIKEKVELILTIIDAEGSLNVAMNTDDATMENFVKWLSSRIGQTFQKLGYDFVGGVHLSIQETPKYGCET